MSSSTIKRVSTWDLGDRQLWDVELEKCGEAGVDKGKYKLRFYNTATTEHTINVLLASDYNTVIGSLLVPPQTLAENSDYTVVLPQPDKYLLWNISSEAIGTAYFKYPC